MPPSTTLSPTPSFHSMDEYLRPSTTTLCDQDKNVLPPSARECLVDLIQQVEHDNLRQVLKIELNRLLTDHERIVTMLQQRTHMLEQDNEQLRGLNSEHQRRYEKAVREMQFFKKKADYLSKQQQSPSIAHSSSNTSNSTASRTRSHSSASETRSEISAISSSAPLPPPHAAPPLPPPPPPQQQPLPPTPASTSTSAINYPLTPTSPQPSVVSEREEYDSLRPLPHSSSSMPSRSSSTSSSNAHHYQQSFWNAPPLPSMSSVMSSSTATSSLADNVRQPPNYPVRHAGTNSIYSVGSDVSYPTPQSSTEAAPHPSLPQHPNGQQKRSWQNLRQNPSVHSSYSSPSTTTTATTTTTTTGGGGGGGGGPVSSAATSVYSVPMTPVRSTISTNGYTGSCMIQQRRVDPLMFGGSDGLWDTISKSQGSDATVEKIIRLVVIIVLLGYFFLLIDKCCLFSQMYSNFLRRGGSPNTAKQSPTCHDVKYGYGMIHALIVTKAPGALDLLLQQGANPNALTLSEADENKVTITHARSRLFYLLISCLIGHTMLSCCSCRLACRFAKSGSSWW